MTRALVLIGGLGTGAFQAGAVAGLAEAGGSWDLVAGSGAGALNGLLAADGRLDAMARLWREQAADGVPVLADRMGRAAAAARAACPGARTALDPWATDGLVDVGMVAELAAPWSAGLAARLASAGRRLLLPVLDLATGRAHVIEPAVELLPEQLPDAVAAATATAVACAPWPLVLPGTASPHPCVDGLAVLPRPLSALLGRLHAPAERLDLVMALPAADPGAAAVAPFGLARIAAAAEGARLAAAVEADLDRLTAGATELRVLRPDASSWRRFTGRSDADLRLEFPDAVSRNGALLELTEAYGRELAAHVCD